MDGRLRGGRRRRPHSDLRQPLPTTLPGVLGRGSGRDRDRLRRRRRQAAASCGAHSAGGRGGPDPGSGRTHDHHHPVHGHRRFYSACRHRHCLQVAPIPDASLPAEHASPFRAGRRRAPIPAPGAPGQHARVPTVINHRADHSLRIVLGAVLRAAHGAGSGPPIASARSATHTGDRRHVSHVSRTSHASHAQVCHKKHKKSKHACAGRLRRRSRTGSDQLRRSRRVRRHRRPPFSDWQRPAASSRT